MVVNFLIWVQICFFVEQGPSLMGGIHLVMVNLIPFFGKMKLWCSISMMVVDGVGNSRPAAQKTWGLSIQ